MRRFRELVGAWGASRVGKVSQVIVANGFNNLASLAITLHAARKMGPEAFGQLGLMLAVVAFGNVLLDLGLSVALVRGYNHDNDVQNRQALVGGVLKAKVLQLLVVILLALPLAEAIRIFLPQIRDLGALALAIVSAGLMSLWMSVRSLEQARRNYATFTRYIYLLGGLRFVLYGIEWLRRDVSSISVILCLYVAPLSLLLLYSLTVRERRFLAVSASELSGEAHALRTAVFYGAWVAGASIFMSLLGRMPLFFLARRSTPRELGLFTAAFTFVGGFALIWDALGTVIMPEVAGLRSAESRLRFRSMLFKKLPLMFAVLSLAIVICVFAQLWLLGPAYRAGIPAFIVLGISTALCMCISVNNNLVHAYGIPSTMTYMNIARVLIVGVAMSLWWHLDSVNVAVIYGVVLLAGDAALFLYVERRVCADRVSLELAAL